VGNGPATAGGFHLSAAGGFSSTGACSRRAARGWCSGFEVLGVRRSRLSALVVRLRQNVRGTSSTC